MLVRARTGMDPMRMTYVKFQGILERLHKIRWHEAGGGVSKDEMMAEHMAAKKAEADDF
jgi:hypothetical protein